MVSFEQMSEKGGGGHFPQQQKNINVWNDIRLYVPKFFFEEQGWGLKVYKEYFCGKGQMILN